MKKIIIILPLILLLLAFGCSDDNDERFRDEPTTGWVSFRGSNTQQTITIITEQVRIPLSINVPVYENGLNVSYTILPVEGDFSQILTTSGNVFVDPADVTRTQAAVVLNFANVADLTEKIVFDVVLTGVDVDGVSIGLDETDVTTYRISTPCPIDIDGLTGTYSVDEMFTGPPNGPNGLSDFFSESYQIVLSPNPGDVTKTSLIVSNGAGADTYINNGTIISFDTCGGTVSFSQSPLQLALFSTLAINTSTYTESPFVITARGAFGNFGDYEFILTKM